MIQPKPRRRLKRKPAATTSRRNLHWVGLIFSGAGLPKDPVQGVQLLEKAAGQGHPEAMLSLAFLQDDSPRINGETRVAPLPNPYWYEQAAAQGNEIAAEAMRQHTNSLVAPSSSRLLQWYRKLANLGVPSAQVLQARYNLNGYGGLKRNPDEARKWLLLAEAQGSGTADAELGILCLQGDGSPPDLAGAVKWLRRGANLGAPLALSQLGLLTASGNGVVKNEVEGLAMMDAAQAEGTVVDADAIADLEKRLAAPLLDVAKKRSQEILGPGKLAAIKSAQAELPNALPPVEKPATAP